MVISGNHYFLIYFFFREEIRWRKALKKTNKSRPND